MTTSDDITNLLNEFFTSKIIAFKKPFVKLGGIGPALMLSQLTYWSDKGTLSDGWFYKTVKEFTEETGMTRYEQETARRKLKSLGVIDVELRGIPAKLHYRVNLNILKARLVHFYNVESRKTSLPLSVKLVCNNPTNSIAGKRRTITENTQKNTLENTTLPRREKLFLKSSDENSLFESFWNLYDHKVGGKQPARRSFEYLTKKEIFQVEIHIPLFIKNHNENGQTKKMPRFHTYLAQKLWERELPYSDKIFS